jgi:hypothetical protein
VILLQSLAMYMFYAAVASHFAKRERGLWVPAVSMVLLLASTCGWYAWLDFKNQPYHSLYVASQGGGESKRGYYFPQDDFYDAGLREAIAGICKDAPPGSLVMGATPSAFQYYQQRFGRPDLEFHSTAEPQLPLSADLEPFILYQEYRTYLENFDLNVFFRAALRPLRTVEIQGIPSVVVYRLCRDSSCARIPFWKARHWPGKLEKLKERSNFIWRRDQT